ncbi:hypothetical protein GCM10023319_17470 [Nocardia iowensis]
MRGIDQRTDLVGPQPLPQPVDAAEAADAHRTDRQQRVANATGERGDDVESLLAGSDVSEFPGFPGTAQNQYSQGWPLK